jgi:hypothetical protein
MGVIDSGMGWAIFGAAFIFIFMMLGILAENQRQKRKLARQELLQKERFMAMEKGLPLPEWGSGLLENDGPVLSDDEAQKRRMAWFRLVTLCVGLFLAFAGAGMTIGFSLSIDVGFRELAMVGLIPFMAGLGLLLFYYLTRDHAS